LLDGDPIQLIEKPNKRGIIDEGILAKTGDQTQEPDTRSQAATMVASSRE